MPPIQTDGLRRRPPRSAIREGHHEPRVSAYSVAQAQLDLVAAEMGLDEYLHNFPCTPQRMEHLLSENLDAVMADAESTGHTLRMAAYILAIGRIAEAAKTAGLLSVVSGALTPAKSTYKTISIKAF